LYDRAPGRTGSDQFNRRQPLPAVAAPMAFRAATVRERLNTPTPPHVHHPIPAKVYNTGRAEL